MWSWLSQVFSGLFDLLRGVGQAIVTTLVNLFQSTFGAIVEFFSGLLYLIQQVGETLWLIVQVIGSLFRVVEGTAVGVLATVRSFYSVDPSRGGYSLGPFAGAWANVLGAVPALDTVGWVAAAAVWLGTAVLTIRVVSRGR